MGLFHQFFGGVPRGTKAIKILKRDGQFEDGYAKPSPLGGWEVWELSGILSAIGENGGFPGGNPWRWERWAFTEDSE